MGLTIKRPGELSTELQQMCVKIGAVKVAPLFVKSEAADRALDALIQWAVGIEGEIMELKRCQGKEKELGQSSA